jgi:hypothetical protein
LNFVVFESTLNYADVGWRVSSGQRFWNTF